MDRRILVLDDESELRSLVARAFRDRGYEVVEAGLASDQLALLGAVSRPFDLVISNCSIPRLGSSSLAAPLDPDQSILYISGSHATRWDHPGTPPDPPTIFHPFSLQELIEEAEQLIFEREGLSARVLELVTHRN